MEGAQSLLEHAGLPSCFWPFAVRFWCFMHNTEVSAGESAWKLRHGAGHLPGKPFRLVVWLISSRGVMLSGLCPSSKGEQTKGCL